MPILIDRSSLKTIMYLKIILKTFCFNHSDHLYFQSGGSSIHGSYVEHVGDIIKHLVSNDVKTYKVLVEACTKVRKHTFTDTAGKIITLFHF